MTTEDTLKANLINFASSLADVIGAEEANDMFVALAAFAQNHPDTLLELKQVVEENPDTVASLMTRKGIQEAKETIELVKNLNLF